MAKCGFIGMGIMGEPMARNLLKAGHDLVIWNRSAPKTNALADEGAVVVGSPKEVGENSDYVFICVTNSGDVVDVINGSEQIQGLSKGLRSGMIVVDHSTISPDVTREIYADLSDLQVSLIDAPVSGGDKGAIAGTLSIMCGGDHDSLQEVMPLLESMGKQITHCGPSGAGQTVKLCNQIAVCINNFALAEALVFCTLNQVDPAVMLEAISAGAAGSWQISNLGPQIIQRDFSPGFKVGLQRKDLHLAIDAADSVNMPLLGTALVDRMFAVAEGIHGSDAGTQALVTALEQLTNVEVKSSS